MPPRGHGQYVDGKRVGTYGADPPKKKKVVKKKPPPVYDPWKDPLTGKDIRGPLAPKPEPKKDTKPAKKTDWRYDPGGGYVDIESGRSVPIAQTEAERKKQAKAFKQLKAAEAARDREESLNKLRAKWRQEREDRKREEIMAQLEAAGFGPSDGITGAIGGFMERIGSDVSKIPGGLYQQGKELGTTFYEDTRENLDAMGRGDFGWRSWVNEDVGRLLGRWGKDTVAQYEYMFNPAHPLRSLERINKNPGFAILAVLPVVGTASKVASVGKISRGVRRAKPQYVTTLIPEDAATVKGWGGDRARIGGRVVEDSGSNKIALRGDDGKVKAVATFYDQGDNIRVGNIASEGGGGSGKSLMQGVARSAAQQNKGIILRSETRGLDPYYRKLGMEEISDGMFYMSPQRVRAFADEGFDVGQFQALRLATRESKRPGYLAAQGFEGGIKPRNLTGRYTRSGAEARPWSKTPIGRTFQRSSDLVSVWLGEGNLLGRTPLKPGSRFTPGQRGARMYERGARKGEQGFKTWIMTREKDIGKGIKTRRGGSINPAKSEALVATLESPMGLTARQAVETKIRDLASLPIRTPQVNAQIALLQEALNGKWLEGAQFTRAVDAATDVSRVADDMAKNRLGMSDAELASRRNRIAQRWADAGLIPDNIAPEARGYFPHRSEYEMIPPNVNPPSLPPGTVVGKPQLGRGYAAKQNELKLYESGEVSRDIRNLTSTVKQRYNVDEKISARQFLYDIGDEIAPPNSFPLEGLPAKGHVDVGLRNLAEQYMESAGLPFTRPTRYVEADPVRGTRIAREYENMRHAPEDPAVAASYEAFINETMAQYQMLDDAGYEFEFMPKGKDPYGGSPWASQRDIQDNKHMYVFPTDEGFGMGVRETVGSTLDEVLENMGANRDWRTKITHRDEATGRPLESDPLPYTRTPDEKTTRPIEYGFRAISEEDWQLAQQRGYLQSDGRMNLGDEGTVAGLDNPSFYLPGKLASDKPGLYEARIVKVRLTDKWKYERDGYVKTKEKIPLDEIEEVSPLLRGERGTRRTAGGSEVPVMPDFQPVRSAAADNPLLRPSGVTWKQELEDGTVVDKPVTNNDLFRAVHDVFGHSKEGVGFRASGEENAWRSHVAMYSDEAKGAMTSETRGQNSWVNFGPHGEKNRGANQADTVYAEQKLGLMPEWTWREGATDDVVPMHGRVPGDDYMFVRNPEESAKRIPREVKAALEDPDAPGAGDIIAKWDNDWVKPGNTFPYEWGQDLANVKIVPRRIVQTVLSDRTSGQSTASAIAGTLNSLVRATVLYLPYGGTRYVARNTIQNMILMTMTRPSAWKEVATAVRGVRKDKDLFHRIQVEAGTVPAAAGLPENLSGRGVARRTEKFSTEQSRRFAGAVGNVADEPWRVAVWIQYAKSYGFKDEKAWRTLLDSDDPQLVRVRENIAQYTRDDMIDFDTLTPWERENLTRWMFIYPFVKGATKWPLMFLREYPIKAGIMASIGAAGNQGPNIEGMPQSTGEQSRLGRTDLGWLSPWDPLAENIERGLAQVRLFQSGRLDLRPMSEFLGPQWRELGTAMFGGGKGYEKYPSTFVPGYSTVDRLRRGGGPLAQVERFLGTAIERPAFRIQERNEEWAKVEAAYAVAGGDYDGNEIVAAFNAHEAYKDLRARAEFAARDLGRKLTPQEKATLLTGIAMRYRPDLPVWSFEDIEDAKNLSAYQEALEEELWGVKTKLKSAATRATRDDREEDQHGG